MDLSAALELLAHASEDDIERCCPVIDVSLLKQTMERLQRLFLNLESHRIHPPPQLLQPPTGLARTLPDRAKEVEKLLSQDYKAVVGRPLAETTNYRLLDIHVVERSKKTSQELIRRVLALRSLAREFVQWNPARLIAIQQKTSFKLPSDKEGSIRSFVSQKFPGDAYENVARKAIKNGLTLLAMEAAFPNLSSGLSAVLGIAVEGVGKETYNELVTTLSSSALTEVRKVAARSVSWMDNAQAFYDGQADAQNTVSDPATLPRTLPPSDQSVTTQKHHTNCLLSRKRLKIMPEGSASNRRRTSQTRANSLPLLATPTHGFQKEPNTTCLYLEPDSGGSGATQDNRGAYPGGRETGSDTDGSGESFHYQRENEGRKTATRHSPISPRETAFESLPTHSVRTDLNSTKESMLYPENGNVIVGATASEDEHRVPYSNPNTVSHGQKRWLPDEGEEDGATQNQTEITVDTDVAIQLTVGGIANSSDLVGVMDENSAANVLQSLQQAIPSPYYNGPRHSRLPLSQNSIPDESGIILEQPMTTGQQSQVKFRGHESASLLQQSVSSEHYVTVNLEQDEVGFDINMLPSACISELDLGYNMFSDFGLLETYTCQ